MQTSIRSTTDSTQHGDLPRRENDGAWRQLVEASRFQLVMMMMMMMMMMNVPVFILCGDRTQTLTAVDANLTGASVIVAHVQ